MTSSTNVVAALAHVAAKHAHSPALLAVDARGRPGARVSFSTLEDMVARCAGGLRERGVEHGDRVVVFVPMSTELYITVLAILRIGAVAVFIDPWGGRGASEAAAALVQPRAFVGVPKAQLLRLTSPTLRAVPVAVEVQPERSRRARLTQRALQLPVRARADVALSFEELLDAPSGRRVHEATEVEPGDPALVTFTTGTTGTPKGASRTHDVLSAQSRALANHVSQSPGDVHLTNLPIVVLHNLACGVTTVLPRAGAAQDSAVSGAQLHRTVTGAGVTVLTLSPAPLAALADAPATLPRVRHIYTGGGPVLPEMLLRVLPVVPHAQVEVLYGSTEAEPIASCTAREVVERRAGVHDHGGIFVGTAVDEVQLRVLRPHDGPLEVVPGSSLADWELEDGSPGEIVVSGAHVNRDYYRNPEAVRAHKVIDEHGTLWHRIGDIARRTPDGELWLLGRVGVDIRVNGKATYALELETPVTDLPEVARRDLRAEIPGR